MESIWKKTWESSKKTTLTGHLQADVVVIGGGMAGILTAWQLEQVGVHAVVLEAERIGSGQTGNTTAKITSQHGMFCHTFIQKKGETTARNYVQANQEAVEEYKRIVRKEGIECNLTEVNAYVYSEDAEKLRKETETAKKLGVGATFVTQTEIPVSCAGAVCFPGQAQFHPLKFMGALAQQLEIYENTRVTEVEKHVVQTALGSVKADKIVFATHYPFVNFPGMYFARMHQQRSYVLALEKAGKLNGMYIGEGENTLSFRSYENYILLGGQAHRTGEKEDRRHYETLKEEAKSRYPGCHVAACWAAQDCMTTDKIPFIGQYAAKRPEWLVATGFQKWGMSSAMVAARLLRDRICGKENPYAEVFTPDRFSAEEMPQLAKDSGKAIKGLTKRFFHIPLETVAMLEPGQGAIVETEEGKVGVYKTEEGELCQVDVVCPHLGCELAWNEEERSWDCPCHGSRFDYKGNLLDGPAQEGIYCCSVREKE